MIMRTKLASLLAALFLVTTAQLSAQTTYTVQAVNDDISYALDLKAVASIFGESQNLEDFERRINDYDNQISNLDLNGDGEIDYLRVVDTSDKSTHLIILQAILDVNVYQDVATIVVDRDDYNRTTVRVIGDPYIYGNNYIIRPYYYGTPLIVNWFWSYNYHRWFSPYYWGYYPTYYRYRRPVSINIYTNRISIHINSHNRYRYDRYYRNDHYNHLYVSVRRNDYGVRHPERTFNRRHTNVSNRRDLDRTSHSVNASRRTSTSRSSSSYSTGSHPNNSSSRHSSYQKSNTQKSRSEGSRTTTSKKSSQPNVSRSHNEVKETTSTSRRSSTVNKPTTKRSTSSKATESSSPTTKSRSSESSKSRSDSRR